MTTEATYQHIPSDSSIGHAAGVRLQRRSPIPSVKVSRSTIHPYADGSWNASKALRFQRGAGRTMIMISSHEMPEPKAGSSPGNAPRNPPAAFNYSVSNAIFTPDLRTIAVGISLPLGLVLSVRGLLGSRSVPSKLGIYRGMDALMCIGLASTRDARGTQDKINRQQL